MHKKKIKALISASGTAGHLIPAIQLAKKLEKSGVDIFFAAYGLENREIFPKDKFKYLDVLSAPITKKTIIFAFFKIFIGFFKSIKLILKYKPDVVVGFGSYHTFPVILASTILRKKIVLFDSNIILGKVNKFFAKKAKFLCLQFERENKLKNEVLVKPLPWIENYKLKENFPRNIALKKQNFTILIFGGSQGSEIINKNFQMTIEDLQKQDKKFQIIHIIGNDQNKEKFKNFYDKLNITSYVSNFEKDFFKFYCLSDLVISRSGAASISELIYFEKPSILVPFKRAKDSHQLKNALFMKNIVKSALIIEEDYLSKTTLLDQILSYLKNDKKKLCLFKENIQKFKAIQSIKNIKDIENIVIDVAKN
ncbi:MAG: UDP-N-acetylglucosamine--N-acetylmuramyl-(pentapeptide) pyrophosphoryl-undecaprenol N-acetylglucosamine transferase [Candidatus Anoxychlamydiales bacterium]|nr:UDP-N-acetylglucosamine--N-acetylmuramyl-(pentapeptide) pyrophosphoryl-undecaprenol N-acetylglucosamine transferase [Candidatus Anoxychlamydiales bacterium]NGX41159.1 UDP-N-acetylglucosamine--N-acetylmuramyl-(pentapeptide) pyrophosphoryl-undecaprenol N-acetylglucosamine transferase [Candidatus Anoxychlamydiales bacterium]HEU64855.1 UDP-N-acetylglucosamine--N-acetylmuramyl-(pentapeptide) pyrophosphoryl-undecaprenol N-acetylglucosamine transferase [Chlamydiota bacterium]